MKNLNRLIADLEQKKKRLLHLQDEVLPVKVGNAAVRHFKKNFRDGGWNDNGLTRWKKTRRQESGGTNAGSQYGPLCSRQNHLMDSITYTPSSGKVEISTPVSYAPFHNNGADITVTPRMKKFAWRQFFTAAGINKSDTPEVKKQKIAGIGAEGKMWRGLALTKKSRLRIPQRRFMGKPKELIDKVNAMIEAEVKKIIEQ